MAGHRTYRPRRLRKTEAIRTLVRETHWDVSHLVAPLFVKSGGRKKEGIPSMPGVYRFSVAEAVKEAAQIHKLGIPAVLLFGIPLKKNRLGTGATAANGIVQQAVKAIKKGVPTLTVMTDVCLCEYTAHGHCGVLGVGPAAERFVDNDATLPLLAQTALSHAKAGADVVAPSAMMDGQVGAIRKLLDSAGFGNVAIMSYSAKYASALYGPFRDAAESQPQFGDRKSYQMDPANSEEALREVELDIQEGADWVMVKPAAAYLDVVRAVKEKFRWPTAVYQVSGEYAMIKAASAQKWVEEKRLVLETITAMRRAGADLIITYYAKAAAQWLKNGERVSE